MTKYRCWFDGACEPINPGGTATYGTVIEIVGGLTTTGSGYAGKGPEISNNVAEYAAVIHILNCLILDDQCEEAVIYGDSQLVIQQLSGKWKARGGLYMDYYRKALSLVEDLKARGCNISFTWIPREQNELCDQLSRGQVGL